MVGGGQKPKHRARPVSPCVGSQYGIALAVTTHPGGAMACPSRSPSLKSRADWLGGRPHSYPADDQRERRSARCAAESIPHCIQAPPAWLDAGAHGDMRAHPPESTSSGMWKFGGFACCTASLAEGIGLGHRPDHRDSAPNRGQGPWCATFPDRVGQGRAKKSLSQGRC